MKQEYIVDEMIFHYAAWLTNEKDESDSSSCNFLVNLLFHCHKIISDRSCRERIRARFTELKTAQLIGNLRPDVFMLFKQIFFNPDKFVVTPEEVIKTIDLSSIPKRYREIAYLAFYKEKDIITPDYEFIRHINDHPEFQAKNIQARHPNDVLYIIRNE